MSLTIRTAIMSDIDIMADLLLQDAAVRHASDPTFWALDLNAKSKLVSTIKSAMEADNPPFRQHWLLAEVGGKTVGITHSILLPVPPIYAGEQGAPGLIMEDCFVAPDAPEGTAAKLLKAAEADLRSAGAKILLASSVVDGAWEATYSAENYAPLTLYFSKVGLGGAAHSANVRKAVDADVPNIVTSSAEHRTILYALDVFWRPHSDADARFGAWMARSLTLGDRDMFVTDAATADFGYAISQPSTPLHFPTPHDISKIGVVDDFYHTALRDPSHISGDGAEAGGLLVAAEDALLDRGNDAVFVVCPAAWHSKVALLESLGYAPAIVWYIKR